ncbi:hypothetical protein WI25_38310 [Burkholderia cepacia]|uniref:hypothetical protein n=1 Tax=Burkholderia cepacia TaxID=292 RepID=UPI0007532182|nr:hypothetical protein WI25_38310 [Burkholderia cepacia]
MVAVVVTHLDHGPVDAIMLRHVPERVVLHLLDAAIAMNMRDQVVVLVAPHPFLGAIRIRDPVHVSADVAVVPRDVALRIGDIGQADVPMPSLRAPFITARRRANFM